MRLCVIPGDGIGREVIPAALSLLRVVAPEVEIVEAEAGWETFQGTGVALPAETLAAARAADAVLFGAVASPSHPVAGYRSPIVALRRELDLYANIRPVDHGRWTMDDGRWGTENREPRTQDDDGRRAAASIVHRPSSMVVVRENTEDLYVGRERLEDDGETAIAERVITRRASERIARVAYELAQARGEMQNAALSVHRLSPSAQRPLPKVTIVHKANVLRVSDGLFREVALGVARGFPDVATEELLVDTAAMHLARSPERFDVIVTTNMFGDILSDIAAIHGGGLGLACSANIGERQALFEPVHGAAPDIAGRGVANPLAAVGCVALLLEWSAERRAQSAERRAQLTAAAAQVRAAVAAVVREGPHTPDMGGAATTEEVVEALVQHLVIDA